jgi:hypothetical protein
VLVYNDILMAFYKVYNIDPHQSDEEAHLPATPIKT